MSPPARIWKVGRETLDLNRPCLLGILNCTPDSFSDGGRWRDASHAVEGALEILEHAVGVDVGGESTRPGSDRVDAETQCARIIPVIEGIRRRSPKVITVDTTLASVAKAALDAGADAINDVSAGTEDVAMLELAAARGCGLVLMHRLCPPDEDRFSTDYDAPPVYEDVVEEVLCWLEQRACAAEAHGVAPEAICVDPGLGFGKSVAQNWALIGASDRLAREGRPVLAAASRKSFIGAVVGGEAPRDLDGASAMVTAVQYTLGLRLFRVHCPRTHEAALERLGAFAATAARGPAC